MKLQKLVHPGCVAALAIRETGLSRIGREHPQRIRRGLVGEPGFPHVLDGHRRRLGYPHVADSLVDRVRRRVREVGEEEAETAARPSSSRCESSATERGRIAAAAELRGRVDRSDADPVGGRASPAGDRDRRAAVLPEHEAAVTRAQPVVDDRARPRSGPGRPPRGPPRRRRVIHSSERAARSSWSRCRPRPGAPAVRAARARARRRPEADPRASTLARCGPASDERVDLGPPADDAG